jgi:outer membrane protein assembly factor BamB
MLDAATGEEIWTRDNVDVETPAATGADVVVVAAQQLIALNGDGIELWRTSPDWCSCTFQFPTIVNDTVVVVTNEASVYGLDVRSGRTCWTVALGDNYGIAHPDSDGFASVAVGGVAGWIDTATGPVASALPLQGRALSIAPTAHGSIVSTSDGYIRMVGHPTTPDPQDGEPPQHQCAQ